MNYEIKTFNELTTSQLYEILQLRSEVFVVEQNCPYQDIDGKDELALHVIGKADGNLVTYTRIFDKGLYYEYPSIGRVVVKESERKYGYGHELINESIKAAKIHFGEHPIKIGAQTYLIKFYESHGFKPDGEEYLEDGIPHVHMILY